MSGSLLALRIGRIPERRHRMRLRAEALQIVDEAVARVLGVLVMHADVDGFLRTHFLAVAAEHAPELVDLVDQRIAVALFVFARYQLDAVRRTDLGTQAARHALRPALLVREHAMRAAPARGQRPIFRRLLLGILHRDFGPQQMAERQRHAFERGTQVRRLLRRAFQDFYADRHQVVSCGMEPETRRPRSSHQTSGTSSATLRPNNTSAIPGPKSHPICTRTNQIAIASTVM